MTKEIKSIMHPTTPYLVTDKDLILCKPHSRQHPANVDDGSSGTPAISISSSNNKYIEYICKFIDLLSTVIYYCSPIVMIIAVYDFKIASIVGFGFFLFKVLVLDLFLFKMGKIRNWPEKLNIIAAKVCGLSVVLAFMVPITNIQFQSKLIFDILVSGSVTVLIAIAWLFGYPIGRLLIVLSDKSKERLVHPVTIQHFIQRTSGFILGTFFLRFMVEIAAAFYYDHGVKEETLVAIIVDSILLSAIGFLLVFCHFYFDKNIEKNTAAYDKEINKLMYRSPNHEMNTTLELDAMIHNNNNDEEGKNDIEEDVGMMT